MSVRCGCSDQGDEMVFGPCRACDPEPETPRRSRLVDLPRLIPSWVFVAPPEPPCPVVHVELGERPWETVLSDDTEPGDLG
jgi:hypothetical protein